MTTFIIIIASLITDITLRGLAYKIAKSQEESVVSLKKIADCLDKRVTVLEERNVVPVTWNRTYGAVPLYLQIPETTD